MLKKIRTSGLVWLWVAVFILIVDRFTKIAVMQHLSYQTPVTVFPFLNLTLFYNTGAAFSFLNSASGWQNGFLGGLACIVTCIILQWLKQTSIKEIWMGVGLSLIVGGALGNAWDRIVYGHVVDFLSFHWNGWYFAIFNVADSAICVGAAMVMIAWLKQRRENLL